MLYGTGLLHTIIAALCPIDGVWIDKPDDPTTWGFWPQVSATKQQQASAQAALAAVTPAALAAADALVQAAAAIPDPLATAKAQAISNLPKPAALPVG